MLFIARQESGDTCGEMLVATMGSDEEGMTVLVVQQQEGSAAQDHT
jgi:hypothetical protein